MEFLLGCFVGSIATTVWWCYWMWRAMDPHD